MLLATNRSIQPLIRVNPLVLEFPWQLIYFLKYFCINLLKVLILIGFDM